VAAARWAVAVAELPALVALVARLDGQLAERLPVAVGQLAEHPAVPAGLPVEEVLSAAWAAALPRA